MRSITTVSLRLARIALAAVMLPAAAFASTPWGEDYFPNVPLTTHEGESVRFFDDLIEGKVVAINFIYTTCPDTCPLETAQLVKVQKLLGERLGRDVFFYSITIDPTTDTPQALNEYRDRFGARWTFLTGDNDDIILLRRTLGLYIEEIQDGSNNHNVSMIIGNQATGRWMKRSPFENPYVLADQLGNWLTGWKSVQPDKDYAEAPTLRSIPLGEQLFRTRCATCHTVNGVEAADALGPDLLGVNDRREPEWLLNWLRAPDQMLADEDPIAIALYERYNRLSMPNMRLNQEEAASILDYIAEESSRLAHTNTSAGGNEKNTVVTDPALMSPALRRSPPAQDVVAVMNAWVRESDSRAKTNAGYLTLVNVSAEDVKLVAVESPAYDSVAVHEMKVVDGLMQMREVAGLVIPARGQVQLAPGGMHLMLMGPAEHLTAGQQVKLTLAFESGHKQTLSIEVENR